MVNNLGEHTSLFNQYIAEIRDQAIQLDSMRFRRNMERCGEIFAYEISKHFTFKKTEVPTPLGIAKVPILVNQPVVASVLRAGLPLIFFKSFTVCFPNKCKLLFTVAKICFAKSTADILLVPVANKIAISSASDNDARPLESNFSRGLSSLDQFFMDKFCNSFMGC